MPEIEDETAATGDGYIIPSLERGQDLLRIAAGIVGDLVSKAKSPAEARFIIAHVRDTVDRWQPASVRPDKPRSGRDGD